MTEPGNTVICRNQDGTRTVDHADPTIRIAAELLNGDLYPDVIEPDGTLRLDSAGQYRYRFARAESDHVHIYERITEDGQHG